MLRASVIETKKTDTSCPCVCPTVTETTITTNTTTTTTLTTITTSKTTTVTLAGNNLGIVSKCTLVGAKKINTYSGKYCVANRGEKSQSEAYSQCRSLNARLPLPKNKDEMAAFLEISSKNTWIGIRTAVRGRNLY